MDEFEFINSKIDEKIGIISNAIVGGQMSFDEYKFSSGKVQGLLAAQGILKDLYDTLGQDDD